MLGPRFEPRRAEYALLPGGTALIEMAAASGLPLVPPEERNPGRTTTYGTGQLIRAALEGGCRTLIIGVGGSATNDCGMGALAALGARFLDGAGQPLEPVGDSLGAVERVDLSGLLPAAREAEVTVMCDIQNPLLGPRGATRVFGPQKGGLPRPAGGAGGGDGPLCPPAGGGPPGSPWPLCPRGGGGRPGRRAAGRAGGTAPVGD